jgi:hypothetical protein
MGRKQTVKKSTASVLLHRKMLWLAIYDDMMTVCPRPMIQYPRVTPTPNVIVGFRTKRGRAVFLKQTIHGSSIKGLAALKKEIRVAEGRGDMVSKVVGADNKSGFKSRWLSGGEA